MNDLYEHFSRANTPLRAFDPLDSRGTAFLSLLDRFAQADTMAHVFSDRLTVDEMEDALCECKLDSAPGLDGVPYRVLHKFRLILLPLLATAFNSFWFHKIPSVTELIFKTGDPLMPSNWRPLALQSALYKLYITIVKSRFSLWLESNGRLNDAQKGFRSFNGCHEHNFVAQSMMDTTRRNKKSLYSAWYDLRNAFGTIPFNLIWLVMERIGVPDSFIQLVQDVYTGASTIVACAEGLTAPIHQRCGVFQGCPLSPLLFLVGVTPLIEALQHMARAHGVELSPGSFTATTALADDIKIYSRTESGVHSLHKVVVDFLDWSTMEANPSKCAYLAIVLQEGRFTTTSTDLFIGQTPIPRLDIKEGYKYLGIREGFDRTHLRFQLSQQLALMRRQVAALLDANLAPWQALHAIKAHVLSQLDYALRHVRCTKSELQSFSPFLHKSLRHFLKLSNNSCTSFFASPTSLGGFGLVPLEDMRDATVLAHGFQMLHSPDPSIQALARAQLHAIVKMRYQIEPKLLAEGGDSVLQHFLNGTMAHLPFATFKSRHADLSSMWIDISRTLRRLNLKFTTAHGQHFQLRIPTFSKELTLQTVARQIKMHIKLAYFDEWAKLKDQGRTTGLHADLGSRFVTTGLSLWDSDYRFAIAARLNQVDTRAVMKTRRLSASGSCRHCGPIHAETLAHVLQR